MPYTLAHPIAAAPIWRLAGRRLPLSALVIGSLSPDFPYLYNLGPTAASGHTFMGLFTNCLPQAFVVFLLWVLWVEKPVLELVGLPRKTLTWTTKSAILVLASLILGAATHNIWDSASHPDGWLVLRVSLLELQVLGVPAFKWVQYGGGVLGLAGLAWWYWGSSPFTQVVRPRSSVILTACTVFPLSIGLFILLANQRHGYDSVPRLVVNSATGVATGIFVGAVVYATVRRMLFDGVGVERIREG